MAASPFLSALPAGLSAFVVEPIPVTVQVAGHRIDLVMDELGASGQFKGIEVRIDLTWFDRALTWTTTVTNSGEHPVDDVNVTPLDLRFDFGSQDLVPRVRHLSGSWHYDALYPSRAFRVTEEAFVTHDHARPVRIGGVNAGIHSPLIQFALGIPMTVGMFAGLEWSGGWRIEAGWAELSFHGEGQPAYRIVAEAEVGVGRLEAGESLVLPPVHMGGTAASAWDALSNLQRAHMRSLRPSSALPTFPVSYDTWFGRYDEFDVDTLRADATRAAQLGVEVFCLDACWYRSDDVHTGLGNWRTPDPRRFPRGVDDIRELAEYVRSLGMKFGLWHLIQLAAPATDVVLERPELFRTVSESESVIRSHREFGSLDEVEMGSFNGLALALESEDAVQYAFSILEGWITDWGVEWFRFESVPFDGSDYNAGYNRLLDLLRERHPGLYIEECNGGGQRLDLNAVRRTHGNWLSDHTSAPEVTRFTQTGALRFWPAHMLNMAVTAFADRGDAHATIYDAMSRMVGPISFNGALSEWSETQQTQSPPRFGHTSPSATFLTAMCPSPYRSLAAPRIGMRSSFTMRPPVSGFSWPSAFPARRA